MNATEVPSFGMNIDPNATLVNERQVKVTVLALCEADAHVMLRVTLTQDRSIGYGSTVEGCTAAMERYPLRIHAHGAEGFGAGPARAELEGVVYRHGRVIDVQQWTRNITLVEGAKSVAGED